MKPFLSLTLLAASLCLPWGPAHAEKADRLQPMHIEADALRHDEQKQTSVFTGNVQVTKGTIILRGERLEVRQMADGTQSGVITGGGGKRAYFRQKRDTVRGAPVEHVEAEAERIEYTGSTDSVRLNQRAQLRRFRADQLQDELSGATIVYNTATDVFTVEGGASAPAVAGQGSGRVRAVLGPKAPAATPGSDAAEDKAAP